MKLIATLIIVFPFLYAKAQAPATGCWLTLQVPVQLSQKWQWHNDAGYRTLGNQLAASQYFYRAGARYFFNKQLSAAVGTAFFFTRTSFVKTNDEFGREPRLWQELDWQVQLSKKWRLQNRLRTEQRFFAATLHSSAFNAFRLRYRLAATFAVSKKWSVQVGDEYMQQAAKGQFKFNQDRLFATAVYQAGSHTQLQGGYMLLRWPTYTQHIFQIIFLQKIALYGKGNNRN